MTTVILDREAGFMYADSRTTHTPVRGTFQRGGLLGITYKVPPEYYTDDTIKVVDIKGVGTFSGSGDVGLLNMLKDHLSTYGCFPKEGYRINWGSYSPKAQVLLSWVDSKGEVQSSNTIFTCKSIPFFKWSFFHTHTLSSEVKVDKQEERYLLTGSGSQYAKCAILGGCDSPVEAIKIASLFDKSTNDNVISHRVIKGVGPSEPYSVDTVWDILLSLVEFNIASK